MRMLSVPKSGLRSLVLHGVTAALLLLAPAAASAVDLDALNEELKVETARLQFALDKIQAMKYPLGVADRRTRKALIREGHVLMEHGARLGWADEAGIRESMAAMVELKKRVQAFHDTVGPAWEKPRHDGRASQPYRSPWMEVLKYRDVAQDAEVVLDGMSTREQHRVKELIAEAEEHVIGITKTRESDHVARDRHVRRIMEIRLELTALRESTRDDRRAGYPFVPHHRQRHHWINVGHEEAAFAVLRARFVAPGSAYLTIENRADERRPLLVEMEFFEDGGDATGSATFETDLTGELRPGEIREILVPIYPSHPSFWDVTTGFSVFLD